jgi:hypothetical protein
VEQMVAVGCDGPQRGGAARRVGWVRARRGGARGPLGARRRCR